MMKDFYIDQTIKNLDKINGEHVEYLSLAMASLTLHFHRGRILNSGSPNI